MLISKYWTKVLDYKRGDSQEASSLQEGIRVRESFMLKGPLIDSLEGFLHFSLVINLSFLQLKYCTWYWQKYQHSHNQGLVKLF